MPQIIEEKELSKNNIFHRKNSIFSTEFYTFSIEKKTEKIFNKIHHSYENDINAASEATACQYIFVVLPPLGEDVIQLI